MNLSIGFKVDEKIEGIWRRCYNIGVVRYWGSMTPGHYDVRVLWCHGAIMLEKVGKAIRAINVEGWNYLREAVYLC